MSNFALNTTDPYGDVISSINYLLATKGADGANIANVLVANATTGQITTSVDPNYLAYLYQFIDVRYADSADGSVNFSTSPTNRLYFGVRNYQTGGGSSNPADYIWTQVAGGGFGTTNFLYYQTIGGRQIQFSVGTTPPGPGFTLVINSTAIDLDILSAVLNNTSLQVIYSPTQNFVRNGEGVWTPNIVGNILSTISNVTIIRSNTIIAQSVKTLNFNVVANTWTISNTGPDINGNSIVYSNASISNDTGYYQTFRYNDFAANISGALDVVVIQSGQTVNGLTISTTYSEGQVFSNFVSNTGVSSWIPNANIGGYVNTSATTSVYNGNVIIGRLTRQLGYDSTSIFAGNIAPNVSGNVANVTYVGNIRTPPIVSDTGRYILTSNVGGYNYHTFLGAAFTANVDKTQYHADYTFVVSGGGTYADLFIVGPGAPGGKLTIDGFPRSDAAGNGGEVKYFPNVYIPVGSYNLRVGGIALFSLTPTQLLSTTVTIGGNTYTANAGGVTTGGAGSGAGGASPDGVTGGPGVAEPWGTVTWLADTVQQTGNISPFTYYEQGNVYYVDSPSVQAPMYFGGGGAWAWQSSPNTNNVFYRGGAGGGGSFLPNNSTAPGEQSGIYGGGGSAVGGYDGSSDNGGGVVIMRINANISTYGNLWVLSNNSVSDINSNRFTIGPGYNSTLSYYTPVSYSDSNSSVSSSIEVTVVPSRSGLNGNTGATGSRGIIPLAYVVTSSDPTLLSNAQLSSAFAAPRDAIIPPIGTGFAPIDGDTAQFVYTTTPTSIVKTYDGTGWTDADGEVIDGNVIVTGTVTASKLAANDIYALTIQSTSATTGSNTSPGFWLQANTGNARFGGGINIGDSLVVGNTAVIGSNANIGGNLIVGANATIGQNLSVTGLITAGNLQANTVNTTTIVPDSVTNSNGVSIVGTVFSNNSVTLANLGLITEGGNTYYLYESDQYYAALSNVQLIYQDTTVTAGISGQTQVQGNVYVDQTFSPFVTSQLYRKDPDGVFTAIAPKNYSLITELFAGNQNIIASQTINDFYSYTVGIIETFSTNGAAQTHEYGWAYSLGALVSGYEATANGNIRGTNPTVGVTQFKR